MAMLIALGLGIGGLSIDETGTTASRAGIATGVWFIISSLISVFAGSYFAARVSKFHTNRIGSAQGLVIASLFFGFFIWQSMAAIGWAGRTVGSAIGGTASIVGSGMNAASDNTVVHNVVENAIGDLNLRSPPETVASGVISRLLRGDHDGAKNYLALQAGITPAEADRRISLLRGQVETATAQAREAASNAMKGAGWSLFLTLLLGTLAATTGGALGSRANLRKPLTREQVEAGTEMRTAPV
jgi:hypothetical protein